MIEHRQPAVAEKLRRRKIRLHLNEERKAEKIAAVYLADRKYNGAIFWAISAMLHRNVVNALHDLARSPRAEANNAALTTLAARRRRT